VTVVVVDLLEPVQVEQDGDDRLAGVGGGVRGVQAAPVVQAGQWIVGELPGGVGQLGT